MEHNGMNGDEMRRKRKHIAKQLAKLTSYRGRDPVRERLGVDDVTLDGLLNCTMDCPEEVAEEIENALDTYRRLDFPVDVDDEVGPGDAGETGTDPGDETEAAEGEDADADAPVESKGPEEVREEEGPSAGDDTDTDNGPEETAMEEGPDDGQEIAEGRDVDAPGPVPAPEEVPGREGAPVNVSIEYEGNPLVLWRMWESIILQFFTADVPEYKQLGGLLLLLGVEMAMLMRFGQVPTDPEVQCIGQRYDSEFERRRRLAGVVRRELEAIHGGFRGFRRWFVGKGRVNTRKLEARLHAEAQDICPDYNPRPVVTLLTPHDLAQATPLVWRYISWHHHRG